MNDMQHLHRFFKSGESAFSTKMQFEAVVHFIKYMADEMNLPLVKDKILILEISEGVFLKTAHVDWNDAIENISKEKEFDVEPISDHELNELTSKHKYPINSFGNERLTRWRVGF
jgi:hypothetical protein